LIDAFNLTARVKLRERLGGLFPLGSALVRGGIPLDTNGLRQYLRRQLDGDFGVDRRFDDVELDPDSRWCPPMIGVGCENQASIEGGQGMVQSCSRVSWEMHCSLEEIRITTWIGKEKIISAPTQ
jgi:hypothetical protein